jgi:hypothetical protein
MLFIEYSWPAVLRIRDTYPGPWMPDPTTISIKSRGVKKLVVLPFLVATYFTKLKIILLLKRYRKKSEPIDKEYMLPKKLSPGSQK